MKNCYITVFAPGTLSISKIYKVIYLGNRLMKYYGAHINGGFARAIELSGKYDINSVQVMPTAPIRWAAKEIPVEPVLKQFSQLKESGKTLVIKKFLLHGVYLINLARGDKQMFHLSKLSLVNYLNFISQLEKDVKKLGFETDFLGVCFHPGSAIDLTEKEGFDRVIYGLDWVLENAPKGKLLLESTAGAGNIMGDTLEELGQMRLRCKYPDRVGFVLDTQHMWASGYDWKGDLEGIFKKIDQLLGLENVASFHINDSKTECGSHKDRHADLGAGVIGVEALKGLVTHPRVKEHPFITEAPALASEEGIVKEVGVLKGWGKG